jgi:hypothetical protein
MIRLMLYLGFRRRLLDGVSGIVPITKFECSEYPTRFGGQIVNFDVEG